MFGKGRVFYIGFVPDDAQADALAGLLLPESGVEPLGMIPNGMIGARRGAGGHDYIFLLNFTDSPAVALLSASELKDALTGEPVEREIGVPARGVSVVVSTSRNTAKNG